MAEDPPTDVSASMAQVAPTFKVTRMRPDNWLRQHQLKLIKDEEKEEVEEKVVVDGELKDDENVVVRANGEVKRLHGLI